MEQYISKSALIAEIERLMSIANSQYDLVGNEDIRNRILWSQQASVCNQILSFLDTIEVKEVQEEPAKIWHDAKEPPEMYRKYFARYSDGRISGSWERHDDGFIPWKDVIKEHNITHWCYVEDLLKLKYYDR